ncbi:hypothetical protein E4U55_004009 [Claviceps digitariae]|nr:hypothetical protein E4U55_004009 [Claviceps digitariae]
MKAWDNRLPSALLVLDAMQEAKYNVPWRLVWLRIRVPAFLRTCNMMQEVEAGRQLAHFRPDGDFIAVLRRLPGQIFVIGSSLAPTIRCWAAVVSRTWPFKT